MLVANVIEMLDEAGGWKAATTALWREHLHAATQIGRVAAAAKAVELGYGIAADEGRSGRLRHWRIAGIPDEVLDLHSKRAGQITAAVAARGTDTYQARNTAARATRAAKRPVPEGELVARWRAELASIGWSVASLNESVDAAAGSRIVAEPSWAELHRVVGVLLADDGPLASATPSVTLTPLGRGSPSSSTPPLPADGGNAAKPAATCLPPPPPQLPPRSISPASSPTSEGGSSRRS